MDHDKSVGYPPPPPPPFRYDTKWPSGLINYSKDSVSAQSVLNCVYRLYFKHTQHVNVLLILPEELHFAMDTHSGWSQ